MSIPIGTFGWKKKYDISTLIFTLHLVSLKTIKVAATGLEKAKQEVEAMILGEI